MENGSARQVAENIDNRKNCAVGDSRCWEEGAWIDEEGDRLEFIDY